MLKRLRQSIADIAGVVDAAGAKAPATSVRKSNELLVDAPDGSAAAAINELERVLTAEKERLINSYVSSLRECLSDKPRFDSVLDALAKDKIIGKDSMDAIAHGFTGGRSKWPSRKAAIEAIRLRFVERAYQDAKLRNAEKAKVW